MIPLEYTISTQWSGKQISQIMKEDLCFSTLDRKRQREEGQLLLDGKSVPGHTTVQQGQTLTILLPDDPFSPIEATEGPLDILYEDRHLLVLNKAPGTTVHPGPNHHGDTVGNFVTWHYRSNGKNHLFRPVNRLDKGTSGLMVVAKHPYAAQRLSQMLHTDRFLRCYSALCEGLIAPGCEIIDAPIGRKAGSVIAREVRSNGKPSTTKFEIMKYYVNMTQIKVWPLTGRTHQIRVHMAHLGHPLVGDFLYGKEDRTRIARPALHSAGLDFEHPVTGEQLSFTAPLPRDMQYLCEQWG